MAEIKSIIVAFDEILASAPELRREAHTILANRLLLEVQNEIGGSGKVASWQDSFVGSGGGYASVRSKANTYHSYVSKNGNLGKSYSVGYITDAIENGHKLRDGTRIKGKGFYRAVKARSEAIAVEAAKAFAEKLADKIN